MTLFFLNIPETAFSAARRAVIPGSANFTSATLLNSVSTGPGQKTEMPTLLFFFPSSAPIASESLNTYAFYA